MTVWSAAVLVVGSGLACLLAALLLLNVRLTTPAPLWLRVADAKLLILWLKAPCPTCGHIGEWMGDTKADRWFYCDHCRQPWLDAKGDKPASKAVA